VLPDLLGILTMQPSRIMLSRDLQLSRMPMLQMYPIKQLLFEHRTLYPWQGVETCTWESHSLAQGSARCLKQRAGCTGEAVTAAGACRRGNDVLCLSREADTTAGP
jgi:hypothetical protein